MPLDFVSSVILALAAFVAGVMNSIAGGGTLLTFPALLGIGVPATIANATSTIALLPGSFAGAWGYRKELATTRPFVLKLLPVSLIGGTLGALLMVQFPNEFKTLVPWLVLTAAVLFLIQPMVSRFIKRRSGSHAPTPTLTSSLTISVMAFQFLVAVYGGYFGAGIGILMLAALSFMNVGDMHQMNSVKTVLASAINFVSIVVFILEGLIWWKHGAIMAIASIAGGYLGARLARRLPPSVVRWVVIVIGLGLAGVYFWKQFVG